MKRIEQTDDERVARIYKQRTIHNWRKQYGFSVPVELFDEFKRNKKYYIKLFALNKELVTMIAESPLPEEYLEAKERKD